MDISVKWLADITEAEYRGSSFNGKNFVDTIRGCSLEQAISKNTYENFRSGPWFCTTCTVSGCF